VIKTGDKIEIITAEEAKPQPEWLQFLVTHRARALVQDYFKTQRRQVLDSGRSILEDRVQQLGFTLDETTLQRIEVAFHSESRDELFYNIGLGNQSLENLEEVLKKSTGTRISWLRRVLHLENKPEDEKAETFIIGSSDPNAPRFSIATCCNPIPGDPVVGFKAPDGTVTIHKKSCKVAETIAATHGDWVVVPKWLEQAEDASFLVRISLKGIDRVGMLNDITRYLSLVMGVNMRRLSLQAESGLFEGYIDLYVNSRDILDKLIKKLSSIEGIDNVTRSEL
jgi:GTP pyrophosphokinase